jgi:two-component system response regulator MtrA
MALAPPTRRVLVVDDHAPTTAMLRAVLTTEKTVTFEVVEAGSGADCLKALEKHGPFDLILLDVKLPDMDGFEVCRAIRHVDAKIPIVFVTGQGDLADFAAGREAGGDSYLVKPVNRASLRSIVLLFTNLERAKPPAENTPTEPKNGES